MRIIIAIDIIDGKCVRLTHGDFSSGRVYNVNPVDVAKEIEASGLKYLHLVDLDGARMRKIRNMKILESIVSSTNLSIDFSGGLTSSDDLISVFNAGAAQVTIGTTAVINPALFIEWLSEFGNERIILGADFRNRKVVTNGWTESSAEEIVTFVNGYHRHGVKYCMCTDTGKDGAMKGPSTGIYREITALSCISLIASGGIISIDDLNELKDAGCRGAIVGKAVYENILNLKELADYAEKENNTMS